MACEARAARALRAKGQRRTASRLLVLSILSHAARHMTASEVVQEARRRALHVSPSTVYRTLASLRDAGIISETLMAGGETRYEWAESSPHHHLQCRVCGSLTEIDNELFAALAARIREEHGFRADVRHMAIQGVCERCAPGRPRADEAVREAAAAS